MAQIRVSTCIEASPAEVWEDVRHIQRHVEWMADAESIEFCGPQTQGVGTRFVCSTRIGPLRLRDQMEITEWEEQQCIGVRHTGLVTGTGRFTLTPAGPDRTEFCWIEDLSFSVWMGGKLAEVAGSRVLEWVWRRNLAALQQRFASVPR